MSDDMLEQFLDEGFDHLNKFELGLLDFEKDYRNLMILQALFRNLHTIKGAAGFFSFSRLEALVHKSENIFGILQKQDEDKRVSNIQNHKLIDLFFKIKDNLKETLDSIKETNSDDRIDNMQLVSDLEKIEGILGGEDKPKLETKAKSKLSSVQQKALAKLRAAKENKESTSSEQETKINDIQLDENIIIKMDTLEDLSSLSSELVLVRNKLKSVFDADSEHLSQIYSDFHKIDQLTQRISNKVMQIRMQPFSSITHKLKRNIRDLAAQCNKEVELIVEGEGIEIDRGILEAIKDPLMHMLRNSIDHGIETPEAREALAKNRQGKIVFSINCSDNNIILTISDDGRGVDVSKLSDKALKNNLVTEAELKQMTKKEILDLIFHSGLSTKENVSNISGRGVGMDVVKDSVSRVNGTIEINTEENQGTEFIIKLPLTMAQSSALIVEVNGQSYALPASYVKELNTIDYEELEGKKSLEIREELYEIAYARELMGGSVEETQELYQDCRLEYLIVNINDKNYLLVIDAVLDLQDIVIKSLPDLVQRYKKYSGATILPNGQVALILDLEKLLSDRSDQELSLDSFKQDLNHQASDDKKQGQAMRLLTFSLGDYYLGIESDMVKEVVFNKPITGIVENEIEGLMNLRDSIVLSKKLSGVLELKQNILSANISVVVDVNKTLLALQVDEIDEFVQIDEDTEICKAPNEEMQNFVKEIYLHNEKPLYLIKEAVLFN